MQNVNVIRQISNQMITEKEETL